ncbi:hypothetical protein R1sor_008156 [Riccia sorocarpa]|uniref:Uncharacterized protein n=1 Tax=Riccia sorocarpa TaxID=122646 RepID=A0ABD3HWM5_9MARC
MQLQSCLELNPQVLHIKDITKYQLTLDVKLECPLVFLDRTHPHMHAWEKPEFSSFLGIVRDLTVSKCFVVVAIMDFCQAPVDFAHALESLGLKDASDYKPVLHQSISQQPFLLEIQPSKWREEVNVDEGVHAEGINLMDKAPRWKGRDVVYFANSSFESEFITKYSKALCKFSKTISDWFVQFGQGKKPAASTPVAATVGDYHASSSDVNVASVVVDDQIISDAWQRLGVAQRQVVSLSLRRLQWSSKSSGDDEQGLGEVPAVNPPAVASMETGELPAVNPPAVEIMGQITVAEDEKPQSQTGDVRVLASGSGDKNRDGKGSRRKGISFLTKTSLD